MWQLSQYQTLVEEQKNATNGIAMMKSRFELRGNIIMMTSESLIEMSKMYHVERKIKWDWSNETRRGDILKKSLVVMKTLAYQHFSLYYFLISLVIIADRLSPPLQTWGFSSRVCLSLPPFHLFLTLFHRYVLNNS